MGEADRQEITQADTGERGDARSESEIECAKMAHLLSESAGALQSSQIARSGKNASCWAKMENDDDEAKGYK